MSIFLDRPPKSPLTPSSSQPEKKQRPLSGDSPSKNDSLSSPNAIKMNSESRYKYDELREVCTLGTGSFGTVKLVHHEASGDVMALKILKKDTLVEYRQERNILSEKKLLLECTSCPFIINLISTFNLPNRLCMLLELVQGGELLTHLYDRTDTIPKSSYGGFAIECIHFYIANILLAYDFMHSRDIVYRDLKPENILLNSDGYIKLADFGFAKVIPYLGIDNEIITKTHTIVGSPEYMAPEMINGIGYDQSVDYWSLGCLIYELIFADSLFADRDGLPLLTQTNVVKSTVESISGSFREPFRSENSSLLELMLSLLVPDPLQRAVFKDMSKIICTEFLGDQYMKDVDSRKVQPTYVPSIEHQMDTSNFYNFDDDDKQLHDSDFTGDQAAFEKF